MKRIYLALCIVCVIVLLAGCAENSNGKKDDSSTAKTSSSTSTEPAPSVPYEKGKNDKEVTNDAGETIYLSEDAENAYIKAVVQQKSEKAEHLLAAVSDQGASVFVFESEKKVAENIKSVYIVTDTLEIIEPPAETAKQLAQSSFEKIN